MVAGAGVEVAALEEGAVLPLLAMGPPPLRQAQDMFRKALHDRVVGHNSGLAVEVYHQTESMGRVTGSVHAVVVYPLIAWTPQRHENVCGIALGQIMYWTRE